MTRACVTSSRVMTSWMAVTIVWTTYGLVALVASSVTSSTVSSASSGVVAGLVSRDEGVCQTRYLSTVNESEAADDGRDAVAIAAVLELRRPKGQGCGVVSAMELQTVAALFWAVGRLNGDHTPGLGPYIPGLRLELRVYDDCSRDVLAARHVGELLSNHPDFNCTPATPPLAGIIGTTTSHTTSFVAGLLSSTKIPHFGTSATVSVLSDNVTYPTFFRTVPSDLTQSKVLVDLVLALNWTYIVGVYTKDNYGIEGFQEFKRLATRAGVCVFKEKAFWHADDHVENSMETFIRELLIEFSNTRYESLGVVYFGHDTEATIMFKMIQDRRSRWHDQEKVNRLYWLVSDGVSTSLTIGGLAKDYTLLSISPATSHLGDINDYFFHAVDHPEELGPYWQTLVTDYLQEVQGCFHRQSPVSRCQLRQKIETFPYLPAALDSFYSLAALLGRAHQEACGGGNVSGLCQTMLESLKQGLLSLVQPQAMNYSLHFAAQRLPSQFRGDRMLVPDQFGDFMPANSALYFINSASDGRWTKIGEYCNGTLDFDSSTSGVLLTIPRSECGTTCRQCLKSDAVRFSYSPGDVLLLGLYSISSPAGSATFACGDFRRQSSSVAALLAFRQAVLSLMPDSQSAGGGRRRFGALVLDDCYNKLTASALLSELFSGKTTLNDTESGEPIDMRKVVAVVGSQSSSVTLSALSLLTPLRVPSISYSATSPDLDDRLSYPYFLRPVPSDSQQARALVEVVKKLNVTYVGALHQNNNYGWRGIQTFVELAQAAGICVETPVPVNEGDSQGDLLEAVRDIRNKDATVVVVFLVEPSVLSLLDAIRSSNLDIIFLASEAWTLSTDTLQGHRGMTARGSLVLTVDTSREAGNVNMAEYLEGLTASAKDATNNLPWMRDFWENEKQCNLPGGFTNNYEVMCASDTKLTGEVVRELAEDQKVVQTINAVTSVTTALQQHCGQHSDPAACMLALTAEQTTTLIRSIQLKDQHQQNFRPYLDSGNGNVGFSLHNVQKTSDGTYAYVQVGRYDPNRGLQIERDLVFYDQIGHPLKGPISSSCLYKVQCRSVCGLGLDTTSRPPVVSTQGAVTGEGQNAGLVAGVVVLALACALLLALVATAVYCARRRGRIPCLGAVRKEGTSRGASPARLRMSSIEARRMSGGIDNSAFQPISPRVSLPLPPVPGSSQEGEGQHHQYNVPSDLDGNISLSSAEESSSYRAATPSMYDPSRPHYCSDDDAATAADVQRRHRPRQHHHSRHHHQDLRRQVQELGHPRNLRDQQQFPSSSSVVSGGRGVAEAGRERPRAHSLAAERPHTLSMQGLHQRDARHGAMDWGGDGVGPLPARARSYSHDTAFRARLGALSDDDQQLLLKYLLTSRQQSLSPGMMPQSSALYPVRNSSSLSPVSPPSSVVSPVDDTSLSLNARDNSSGGRRPSFFLQQSQTPESQRRRVSTVSRGILFENPPAFCSSSGTLDQRQEDNPSLLYLHPVPTENTYLELIADPVVDDHSSSPPHHHPHNITADAPSHSLSSPPTSSNTVSSSVPRVKATAGVSSAPPVINRESSLPTVASGAPAVVSQTLPGALATSSLAQSSTPSPQPPAMSPPLPVSVPGSATSESSGAVFMSPDQEFPPANFSKFSASPKNVSPSAVNMSSTPAESSTSGQLRSPQHSPGVSQEQDRTAAGTARLPSPAQQPMRASDVLQQTMAGGSASTSPPLQQQSTETPSTTLFPYSPPPHTSPQSAGTFPGMFVMDRTGAVFWLPGVMMPPPQQQQQGAGVAPSTMPAVPVPVPVTTAATAQLSPSLVFSPQAGGGHMSPTQPGPPLHHSDSASGVQSPEMTKQALTETTSPGWDPSLLTSPTPRLTPVTMTPVQQTPLTLTPTSRPQAPPPVTLTERSRTPKMGVDSLSVLKKQTEVVDQNHNENGSTELHTTAAEGVDSHPKGVGGESMNDLSKVSSTWTGEPTEHPGSPQRTQAAGPGLDSVVASAHDGRSVHVEDREQLLSPVQTPSPCKALDYPEISGGSGGSNQTSGDSGTGEDLNIDPDGVNLMTEICV